MRERREISFCGLIVLDVEVSEFILVLRGCDHAQVLLQILLLQVFLRQVLKVPLAEGDAAGDNDALRVLGDLDVAAQVSGLAVNLYALLEEVFEVVEDDDVVLDRESTVDRVLQANLLLLLRTLLEHNLLAHLFAIFNIK